MDTRERVLYHQIHPLKLATDFGTAFAALALLWQHRLVAALLVMWVPSVVVTLALIRFGGFERIRDSRAGACLRRSMTSAVEALRFGGLGIAAWAAWIHAGMGIAAGFVVIALCWCWVFYRPAPRSVG